MPGQLASISAAAEEGVNQEELARPACQTPCPTVRGGHRRPGRRGVLRQLLPVHRRLPVGAADLRHRRAVRSTFLISNMFSIVLGQRVRELGCCGPSAPARARSCGRCWASRWSSGLFGSIVGGILGLGVARPPAGHHRRHRRRQPARRARREAHHLGGGAGRGHAGRRVLSSLLPAWRAGRVSPVTAMRDGRRGHLGSAAVHHPPRRGCPLPGPRRADAGRGPVRQPRQHGQRADPDRRGCRADLLRGGPAQRGHRPPGHAVPRPAPLRPRRPACWGRLVGLSALGILVGRRRLGQPGA